ncbi:MAG: nicotinate phosphoribosyltransferase [Conexivisphaerales archaeon]
MNDLKDRLFWISTDKEIKDAIATDYYFLNTEKALLKSGLNPKVTMEVYARKLPYKQQWGIVSGIYEAAKLLEGLSVDVDAMEEGTLFVTPEENAGYEPVMQIRGRYAVFARYETPLLGFISSATGFITKAARIRLMADDKTLLSFGTRRAHPALAPLIERSAYLAGFDGVSNVAGAKLLGIKGSGTMPHSFILCYPSQKEAWKAFLEAAEEKKIIALTDTMYDEKVESLMAYETLGKNLAGVRLDTPSTRRGDWRKIVQEVRWELDLHGAKHVKIFISGGLDEEEIARMKDIVDGFGVGTSVSSAPAVDFNMKLVEVEQNGRMVPKAKRGDLSGAKSLYRDMKSLEDFLTPAGFRASSNLTPLLTPLIRNGKIVREFLSIEEIREKVKSSLDAVRRGIPKLTVISRV